MNLDETIRTNCAKLEEIASQYAEGSEYREVLKLAAFAYVFAMLGHQKDFEEYLLTVRKPLTREERDRLRRIVRGE
jgi:hypothetical protein